MTYCLFLAIVAKAIAISALKPAEIFTELGPSLIMIMGSRCFIFMALQEIVWVK